MKCLPARIPPPNLGNYSNCWLLRNENCFCWEPLSPIQNQHDFLLIFIVESPWVYGHLWYQLIWLFGEIKIIILPYIEGFVLIFIHCEFISRYSFNNIEIQMVLPYLELRFCSFWSSEVSFSAIRKLVSLPYPTTWTDGRSWL